MIRYLKDAGLIEVKETEKGENILITPKGEKKVLEIELKLLTQKSEFPLRKDKRWIMVMFDIPEKERRKRDLLRSILKSLKFKEFQKSVWICPYDVMDLLERYLKFYALKKFTKIFLIKEISL